MTAMKRSRSASTAPQVHGTGTGDASGPSPRRRPRRALAALGATATIAGVAVVGLAQPASALVSVTTSGTTMTVNFTGSGPLSITCAGGVVTVGGQTGSPTVPCATFTKLTVNGDSGGQTIDGSALEVPAFAAKPFLVADLGDGADTVTPTTRADDIDLGPGKDTLYLVRGANDTLLDGGSEQDYIRIEGSYGDDEITASSVNATLTVNHAVGGVLRATTAKNFDRVEAATFDGDDNVDLSGITATSSLKSGGIYTDKGDDIVRGPQFGASLFAGPGDNQVFGGAGDDVIGSEGNGDVIKVGDGSNRVYDRNSGRSGRVVDTPGTSNWYFFEGGLGDTTSRVRPGSGNSTVVTNSLTRTGQQVLPQSYKNVGSDLVVNSAGSARGLVDVVALNSSRKIYTSGDTADDDLLDVTIPSGAWTTVGTPQTNLTITPTGGVYNEVKAADFGQVSIHGPWTNLNQGFVHRVTRDLMFRFETPANVTSIGNALGQGTTSRAVIVGGLMDTDEYRGLDVDRTFTRYLKRAVDPGGRTYWINSIHSGKALWRFRAQLFGSNEYFTKAGGTNTAYLDRVYFDVLGRLPDPSGRAFWVNKLNAGVDRGSVALQFINAQEFRRSVIDDQFLRFLDRKATPAEQATWVPQLATATGEQQLIASLAVGAEYFNRS
jgi:hypothetical protein